MAAVSVLPEWVHSPETQNPRSTDELDAYCLPHEALKVVSPPVPASIPNCRLTGAKKPPQKIVS
jgi:hypothetical protein